MSTHAPLPPPKVVTIMEYDLNNDLPPEADKSTRHVKLMWEKARPNAGQLVLFELFGQEPSSMFR